MKVLYKWNECFRFVNRSDAYYLEIYKTEITSELLSLLNNDKNSLSLDDRYYEQVNEWATSNKEFGLANNDCIYILIDKDITTVILCPVHYPYSSQWGAYCPFMFLYDFEFPVEDYLKNAITINDLKDIKRIEEIIISQGYTPKVENHSNQ